VGNVAIVVGLSVVGTDGDPLLRTIGEERDGNVAHRSLSVTSISYRRRRPMEDAFTFFTDRSDGRGHTSPTGNSSTPARANTGGTPFDAVSPAVGFGTVSSGQAFELQSTGGDGGIEFGSGHRVGHRVRLSGLRLPDYPTTSEGDGGRGRGIDFGKVLGTFLNALGFQIGGDGLQD